MPHHRADQGEPPQPPPGPVAPARTGAVGVRRGDPHPVDVDRPRRPAQRPLGSQANGLRGTGLLSAREHIDVHAPALAAVSQARLPREGPLGNHDRLGAKPRRGRGAETRPQSPAHRASTPPRPPHRPQGAISPPPVPSGARARAPRSSAGTGARARSALRPPARATPREPRRPPPSSPRQRRSAPRRRPRCGGRRPRRIPHARSARASPARTARTSRRPQPATTIMSSGREPSRYRPQKAHLPHPRSSRGPVPASSASAASRATSAPVVPSSR